MSLTAIFATTNEPDSTSKFQLPLWPMSKAQRYEFGRLKPRRFKFAPQAYIQPGK